MIWLPIDVWFGWFCLSVDLRFKRFGCQMIWGSSDLVVNWCVIQMILSNEAFLRDFLQNWSFESSKTKLFCETSFKIEALKLKKKSFSERLLSKKKIWSSKTKLFCETSFKIEALKLKNKAFLRDFLKNWSCEALKRSFSARFFSKKNWSSKTKPFCEISFKIEALKLKNETFLRDFLQKPSFGAQKWSFSARFPSKLKLWTSKTKLFCETSFKNQALKLKNEAFLRDFLQNWSFEVQKRSFLRDFKIEVLKIKNKAFLRDFLQKWHVDQTLDFRIPIRFSDF